MKSKESAEDSQRTALSIRQVQFMETRENTFQQVGPPEEETKQVKIKEEIKVEESEELPGQMYDAELR